MISEANINNLGSFKYYEYNDTESAPVEVGPMVGDWSSYKMLGSEAYTADEIHKNMRIIYDKICEDENTYISDETKIQREPGLSTKMLNNLYTTSEDFTYTVPNGKFMTESVTVPKGKSAEVSGYFLPSKSGLYQFTSSGKNVDSWIGDVAIYEYKESNRTINNIELNKNNYYAVRFQIKNEVEANLKFTISVTCNGELVTKPEFVTLFRQNNRYERKLLYYGLIYATDNKYYCYYDDDGNHDMIINSKYKTVMEMTKPLPSDAAPFSTNVSIIDGQRTTVGADTAVFEVNVNSASYTTNPTYENVKATRQMTDWNNAYESYQFTGKRWVWETRYRSYRTWSWFRWRTRTVPYRVGVLKDFTETRRRLKNPLPKYDQEYTYRRRVPPQRFNVTNEVTNKVGTSMQPSDVTNARDGTFNARTTNTLKPNIAKSISMNAAGEIIATYNNTTPIVLFPASGPNCSKMIQIHGKDGSTKAGTVTGCDNTWLDPMKPSEKLSAVANNTWKSLGVSSVLVAGTPLTSIISQDNHFKLEMSPDSKLLFTYCVDPYVKLGNVYFSKAINHSIYAYRPTYNRLSGKMYFETTNKENKELIQVKSNDETLIFSSFKKHDGGYPLVPSEYETITKPTTPNNCRQQCEDEPSCGNYVTYGESGCMLDGTYNNKPIFAKSSTISKPNIYTKKYAMNSEKGPIPFVPMDILQFSDYKIIIDESKQPTKITATKDSSIIDAKSDYSGALSELNDLKTKEPFESGIPARFLNKLPNAPETSVEEGRIEDLQMIMFQQNMMYSLTSIASLTFLASAIVLVNK
jgi:hypothetical protein